jgi:uncharacterized RDD family membrane protein YckC
VLINVAAEELTVRGLTGVDMKLGVAGIGTRAYAFVIDWHIRLLLALAWILLGALIARTQPGWLPAARGGRVLASLVVMLPALLCYFLYHPVLEVLMHGRTPGKRIAGARIVTREGATPGTGALLMRNLFRLLDTLPVLYALGVVCCMLTPQRVRIGDLAAGTVLVIDESKSKAKSLERLGALAQHSGLDPGAAALIADLLDRWQDLEPAGRSRVARGLLKKLDPTRPSEQVDSLDEASLRALLQDLLGRL